jgi:hypothetical protein
MVKNLLETGTPFDYKDVDFDNLNKLISKYRANHSNSETNDLLNLDLDAPVQIGQDDSPDKNQKYIDKDKSFEDE